MTNANIIQRKNAKATRSAKQISKKDKDVMQASILTLIYEGFFLHYMWNANLTGLLVSTGIFTLILYMDNRTERVRKRLYKYKKAYYEQVTAPAIENEFDHERKARAEFVERTRDNNRKTVEAAYAAIRNDDFSSSKVNTAV